MNLGENSLIFPFSMWDTDFKGPLYLSWSFYVNYALSIDSNEFRWGFSYTLTLLQRYSNSQFLGILGSTSIYLPWLVILWLYILGFIFWPSTIISCQISTSATLNRLYMACHSQDVMTTLCKGVDFEFMFYWLLPLDYYTNNHTSSTYSFVWRRCAIQIPLYKPD